MTVLEDRGEGQPETPGAVEEVVFSMSDASYPFVGISDAEGCHVALETILPRGDDYFAEYFSVVGTDPASVVDLAAEHDQVEPRVLATRDDGGLFEFLVSGGCPARRLAVLGALPREVSARNGDGRIVAETLPGSDAGEVIERFLDSFPAADLVLKREKDQPLPLFTQREFRAAMDSQVTDRQLEVLEAAFEAGYYERPRRNTGEEVAGHLGMSSATFSQHIRSAERNLLTILYGE